MTSIKNILAAAILSAAVFGSAEAAEQTIRPIQGASFHADTKHAVAYFLNEDRTCKLVLTLADDAAEFAPIRLEAAIEPGQSAQYPLAEGKSLEFACQAEAQALHIKSLQAVAAN